MFKTERVIAREGGYGARNSTGPAEGQGATEKRRAQSLMKGRAREDAPSPSSLGARRGTRRVVIIPNTFPEAMGLPEVARWREAPTRSLKQHYAHSPATFSPMEITAATTTATWRFAHTIIYDTFIIPSATRPLQHRHCRAHQLLNDYKWRLQHTKIRRTIIIIIIVFIVVSERDRLLQQRLLPYYSNEYYYSTCSYSNE